ncbi:hypothetical protein V8B97DRAFT_1917739 [Scleroderma yunnanense]
MYFMDRVTGVPDKKDEAAKWSDNIAKYGLNHGKTTKDGGLEQMSSGYPITDGIFVDPLICISQSGLLWSREEHWLVDGNAEIIQGRGRYMNVHHTLLAASLVVGDLGLEYLGTSETQAVPLHFESTTRQGDVQQCDSNGIASTIGSTVTSFLGQGSFTVMSESDGCQVPPQLQRPLRSLYAQRFLRTSVPILETLGNPLNFLLHNQESQCVPLSGPPPMVQLSIAHSSTIAPPSPMEAYHPTNIFCPVSLEVPQLYLRDFPSYTSAPVSSPSIPNIPVNPWLHQADLCTLVDGTPPVADDTSTPAEHVMPQCRTLSKFRCGWRDQHGTICNIVITYDCQGHFAMAHGITNLS